MPKQPDIGRVRMKDTVLALTAFSYLLYFLLSVLTVYLACNITLQ